jgi:hypothetical protein
VNHGRGHTRATSAADEDYRRHPTVRRLVVAVYDLNGNWTNPAGFEHDLTRAHDGLEVEVVVVPWIGPVADESAYGLSQCASSQAREQHEPRRRCSNSPGSYEPFAAALCSMPSRSHWIAAAVSEAS